MKKFKVNIFIWVCFLLIILVNINTPPVRADATIDDIINKINATYNSKPIITSEFKQIDGSGQVSYGWLALDKLNNRARIEYKKQDLRIIVNNNSIMMEQIKLKEKTFSLLNNSPFKLLFGKSINLQDSNLKITSVKEISVGYAVNLQYNDKNLKTGLTIFFNKNYYLLGWQILDDLKNTTTVILFNTSYRNIGIDKSIFNTHRIKKVRFIEIK